MISQTALRRRKSTRIQDQINFLQRDVEDVTAALQRQAQQIQMGKLADWVGSRLTIHSEDEEEAIVIAADEDSAFIQSSNFSPTLGFRLDTTGLTTINNDLILGGHNDNPIQLLLQGNNNGNWIARSIWQAQDGTNLDVGTVGTEDDQPLGSFVMRRGNRTYFCIDAENNMVRIPSLAGFPRIFYNGNERSDIATIFIGSDTPVGGVAGDIWIDTSGDSP